MVTWHTQSFRELAAPVADVLGARTAKDLEKLRIHTVGDLLRHLPRRYLSGTELTDLATLEAGDHVAVMAKVSSTKIVNGGRNRPSRLEVSLTDGRGYLAVTFFGREHLVEYWQRELAKGVRGIFVGKVGRFREQLQLTHPEFVMLNASGAIVGSSEKKQLIATMSRSAALVGMYPATAKLPTWKVAECCRLGLATLSGADDPWPDWVLDAADVMRQADAFAAVHQPHTLAEAEAGAQRLRFDEAFATQLTMAYRRADVATHTAVRRRAVPGGLLDALDARLPFTLTDGQREVCDTLFAELDRARPMQRLLQGEVGSGKTVVALRAMLAVVDAGGQCALLAPTEVLAQQHYATIRALMGDLAGGRLLGSPDVATDVVLLTGSMPAAAKRSALLRAASGEAGIVVGTHALLNDKVQFADLGFIVIDEQHRFGVEQRGAPKNRQSRLLEPADRPRHHMLLLDLFFEKPRDLRPDGLKLAALVGKIGAGTAKSARPQRDDATDALAKLRVALFVRVPECIPRLSQLGQNHRRNFVGSVTSHQRSNATACLHTHRIDRRHTTASPIGLVLTLDGHRIHTKARSRRTQVENQVNGLRALGKVMRRNQAAFLGKTEQCQQTDDGNC